ncbi:MAG: glycosyltransferase family 87 protein [bacterium]|jgi:hypothetical protein
MENTEHHRVSLWCLPSRLVWLVLITVFWVPFYSAIHYGQITPIITGILALGIGQKPFVRGLLVGLAAALKPTFALLLPFVSISFGWYAFAGCLAGASLSLIPPDLFMDYVRVFPKLTERGYDAPGFISIFGVYGSVIIVSVICLYFTWLWRGREKSYMAFIAADVIGTATWWHAYTPLIIPVIFLVSRKTGNSPPVVVVNSRKE